MRAFTLAQLPMGEGQDLRDIADPESLANPAMWLLIGLLLLVALITLILLLRAWLSSRRNRLHPPSLPAAPRTQALSELQQLRTQAAQLPPNDVAAKIEEILRVFLHREYGAPAKFSTTDELFGRRRLAHEPPPRPDMMRFEMPFRACDHIRFSQTPEADAIAAITGAEHALTDSEVSAESVPSPQPPSSIAL